MASITSLMSSTSTSSIYGSRNVLSGLASGMDTESMIENAVSGIKTKITTLMQKRTKLEWQQEAFRSIIDKAVNLNTKYTSYTSATNLLSQSFFNNAVNTAVLGTYADKVTASGKSTSDIKINAVKQMATAASYTVSGLAGVSSGEIASAVGGKDFDINSNMTVSNISGSLTFQYGGTNGTTFDITFDELEDIDAMEGSTNAEKVANAINKKLSEVTYNYTKNGFAETTTADKAIKAVANPDGRISFVENELDNGNDITISSASGKIKDVFGISDSGDNKVLTVSNNTELANHEVKTYQYLADKELSVSLNGVAKKISLDSVIKNTEVDTDDANSSFLENLQKELDSAFGKDVNGSSKVMVSQDENGKLSFTPSEKGSTLTLGGSAVEAMGFESGDSNYINTSKKLTDLLGDRADSVFSQDNRLKGTSAAITKTSPNGTVYYVDSAGNRVDKDGYRIEADGTAIYDFEINGAHINVTENTTLESLVNSINANPDAGVKVSYSKLTNEFKFTATETGSNGKIELGGMAEDLFGATQDANFTAGQDAIMDVEINGVRFTDLTRSTNSFDLDGLTVNVKGTFNEDGSNIDKDGNTIEPVTFNTTTDTEKIIDAIRNFVNDYNELATEIKSAYSTLPGQQTDGSRYEPLTAEQESGMTESEIAAYNEKAKQGLLFGDSTLTSMYSKLLSAITPGGTDGQTLREIGIGTSYSDGMTTLSLDEDKLRTALESDPDKVKNAFTKTTESGSSSDGLMQTLQNTLNTYVKTTGEPKGVLITKAGSTKAPTSLNSNSLLSQMNSIDTQIERWQDKMSSQIDRYTTQFTRLEQLIAEMNSQASTLSGLMGGTTGY